MKKLLKDSLLILFTTIGCIGMVEFISYGLLLNGIKVTPKNNSAYEILDFNQLTQILNKEVEVENRVFTLASRLKEWGIYDYEKLNFEKKNHPSPSDKDHLRLFNDYPGFSFFYNISPNFKQTIRLYKKNSDEVLYSAKYTINDYGWRETNLNQSKFNSKVSLLFWGCSFTFGEGLNDDEIFASVLSERMKIQTYNFGVPGSSPARIAYALEKSSDKLYFDESDKNIKISFYVYMNDHLRRIIKSPQVLNDDFLLLNEPFFYLDSQELKSVDNLSDHNVFHSSMIRLLAKSSFLKVLNLNYPSINKNTIKLLGKIIVKLRDSIKKKHPTNKDFYFIFWPGENFLNQQIKDELEINNIKYLDYSGINVHELLKGRHTQVSDAHPSVVTNNLLAFLIEKDLENILDKFSD